MKPAPAFHVAIIQPSVLVCLPSCSFLLSWARLWWAVADSVHAASRIGCHALFCASNGHPVHYRNAYWRYHLALADEALCAAEHIGHIFSRRSTRPGLLQSLLEDIFLELRSETI